MMHEYRSPGGAGVGCIARKGAEMPDLSVRRGALDDIMSSSCRIPYEYWNNLASTRPLPAWPEVSLIELPAHVVQFVRVVDVIDGGDDFVYRFWGTGMVDVTGLERTGQRVSETGHVRVSQLIAEYRDVIEEKAPSTIAYEADVEGTGIEGGPLRALTVRLPLASDGNTVDCVMSFTDFLSDRERWRDFFRNR